MPLVYQVTAWMNDYLGIGFIKESFSQMASINSNSFVATSCKRAFQITSRNSNDWLEIVKSDTMSDPFIYYRSDANKLINSSICRMICFGLKPKTKEKERERVNNFGGKWENGSVWDGDWWIGLKHWIELKAKVNTTIRSFQVISMSNKVPLVFRINFGIDSVRRNDIYFHGTCVYYAFEAFLLMLQMQN